MTKIDIIKPYLTDITLDEPKKLVKAMGICGAVLGFWEFGGISGRQLRRFMSKSAREAAYIEFDVPKKSGGVRRISAPVEGLKQIQQALNLMLQAICEVSPAAMGFVPGRSVRSNAAAHIGSSVIFNCDLKDFFPSLTKEMVRTALRTELKPFSPSRDVINIICNLVTAPRTDGAEALPQGAPTSPAISNLVLKSLDRRLIGFAEKNGYRYTRYADDITFSHTGKYNSIVPIKSDAILSIIADCGLTVNPKKTVIYLASKRREVTGLTVGDKINVSRKYVKQLRTLLHLWETRGLEEAETIYNRDFCDDNNVVDFTCVINGKINYLCMIKGRDDSTYRHFKYRYRQLIQQLKASKQQ